AIETASCVRAVGRRSRERALSTVVREIDSRMRNLETHPCDCEPPEIDGKSLLFVLGALVVHAPGVERVVRDAATAPLEIHAVDREGHHGIAAGVAAGG